MLAHSPPFVAFLTPQLFPGPAPGKRFFDPLPKKILRFRTRKAWPASQQYLSRARAFRLRAGGRGCGRVCCNLRPGRWRWLWPWLPVLLPLVVGRPCLVRWLLSGLPAGGSRLLFPLFPLFLCLLAACAAPWACMSAPHRPRPHRPQPPRRQSAAHGSGSHHATPGPICRRCLPLICRPSCPGSCPPPFCRRSCPAARRRVLCARSGILIAWIYTPPIIPQTQHFPQKIAPEICAKKTSPVPPKGGRGNGFGPIDGPKKCRYHSSQAKATRPRPPDPPPGTVQRGPSERADTAHGLGHPPKCPSERSGAARKGAGANRRRSNATVTVTAGTTGGSKKGPGRCA